jgi:hypothetical protein
VYKFADRVRESTATTGTGTITLSGTFPGFRAFSSAFTNADVIYYTLVSGNDWEVGIGTYSTNTLTRDTVTSSSSGGSKITLVGTSEVFCSFPAKAINDIIDETTAMAIALG